MEEPGIFSGIFAPIEYLMNTDCDTGRAKLRAGNNPAYGTDKNFGLPADQKATAINEGNATPATADEKVARQIQRQSQAYATKADGTLSKGRRKPHERVPADADSNADFDGHVLHAVQFRLRRRTSVVPVDAELIGTRPDLCVALFERGDNLPATKDDVHVRPKSADENHDDYHADIYRLDQFAIPRRARALLGDNERRANRSAVVDKPTRRQGGGLNG